MPTKSKSTKNVVSTRGYSKYRVQSNGIVKALGGNSHFAPSNTIYNIFLRLYKRNETSLEVTVYVGKMSVVVYSVQKNSLGGFSIGCNDFDAKNSRKFFRLVGVRKSDLVRFFPQQAKAAAAGQ